MLQQIVISELKTDDKQSTVIIIIAHFFLEVVL